MPKYEVKSTIKLDGKLHQPGGEPLTLDAEIAAPLVSSGSLVEIAAKAQPKGEPKTAAKAPAKK